MGFWGHKRYREQEEKVRGDLEQKVVAKLGEEGLSGRELAKRFGVTPQAVYQMLNRKPKISTLIRLAASLGYRVEIRLVKDPTIPNTTLDEI